MSVGHGVPPKVVSMQKGFWHTDIPVDAGITYWTFHQQWLYGHKKTTNHVVEGILVRSVKGYQLLHLFLAAISFSPLQCRHT